MLSGKRRRVALLGAVLATVAGLWMLGTSLGGSTADACPSGKEEARVERPNVVVVMTDDQHQRSMRVMRHVKRELKRKGTTFRNYFATFPLCCPSRATFFTGQYAHNHGVLSNKPPEGGYEKLRHEGSLQVALQCGGYRTGYIGKFLNGYGGRDNDPEEVPPGWSEWFVKVEGGYFDYVMNHNGELRRFGNDVREYRTDLEGRRAARFIRRSADRSEPFFLVMATQAPHTESGGSIRPAPRHLDSFENEPLDRRPSFNEEDVSDKPSGHRGKGKKDPRKLRQQNRDRLRSLLAVDETVERMDRALRRSGVRDDTLVIFTSDNGYFNGEHRLAGKTKFGGLYDEAVRVPFVMRGPGVPRDRVRTQITGNIDLAPTILDVARTDPGRKLDGLSLMPLVRGERRTGRRDVLLEDVESKAVRSRRFMYAEHPGGEAELYDLRKDPHQLRSRHADPGYRDVRRRLAERLRTLEDCSGEECS